MDKKMIKFDLFAELQGTLAGEFDFLAKAVSEDETRFFMEWILIEPVDADDVTKGLRAIATDGARLHIVEKLHASVELYGITDGHYKIVKSNRTVTQITRVSADTEEICGKFPDWRRVMPEGDPVKIIDFNGFALKGTTSVLLFRDTIRFFREFPEDTYFSPNYLSALPVGYPWKCHYWASNKGVKFVSNNMTAVIMPLSKE